MLAQQRNRRKRCGGRAMREQVHARSRHQIGRRARLRFGHLPQAETVAHRHAALHAERLGALADLANREQPEIVGLVQMHIHAHAMLVRDGKDAVELPRRIAIDLARVHAADQIGTERNRGVQQIERAGAAHHAHLRKRDDLHVHPVAMILPRLQHAFHRGEAVLRLHIHMRAQRARAVRCAGADQMPRALRRGQRERWHQLQLGLDAARARGACGMRHPRQAVQRLVEMHMPVEQRGQHQQARQIERVIGSGRIAHRHDAGDQALMHREPYQPTIGEPRVVDVAGLCRRLGAGFFRWVRGAHVLVVFLLSSICLF